MNRPEALNALTVRMLAEIRHAIEQLSKTNAWWVSCSRVLAGVFARVWICMPWTPSGSGQAKDDLSHLHANPEILSWAKIELLNHMMSVRKPIVAAINGALRWAWLSLQPSPICGSSSAKPNSARPFSPRAHCRHGVEPTLPRSMDLARSQTCCGVHESLTRRSQRHWPCRASG